MGGVCFNEAGVLGGLSGIMGRGVVVVWVSGWGVWYGSLPDGVFWAWIGEWLLRGVVWLAGDGFHASYCMRLSCVAVWVCKVSRVRWRRVEGGLRSGMGCMRVVLLVGRGGESSWLLCVWCCVAG